MRGNKTRHCLVAAVMFSVSSWAFAQSAATTAAVTSAAEMSPAQIRTTTADLLQ
ncbi:inhibitor of vertebrate lysozyme [Yersinia intermedia]|nr:inhibitor of vertebrate lysozyme [Yersinia intermedia]CQD81678.1 inhibitor of vertebrate lysozyme [Yersinia intermedia]